MEKFDISCLPIGGSIGASELTYLQYAIMPTLFSEHIQALVLHEQYRTLADIFHLNSQTLLEFSEIPPSYDYSQLSVYNLTASALTSQLFRLLKMLFRKIPIHALDLFFDGSVNIGLYRIIINELVQEENDRNNELMEENLSESSYNQYSCPLNSIFHQPLKLETSYVSYLISLQHYYIMRDIYLQIEKGYKITESIQKEKWQQLKVYQQVYRDQIEPMWYGDNVYGSYCLSYKKMLNKLLYILDKPVQKSETPTNKQHSFKIGFEKEDGIVSHHLNHFYQILKIQSEKEKTVIAKYRRMIDEGIFTIEVIDAVERYCLLYLEEFKVSKLETKVNVFMLMIGINCLKGQLMPEGNQQTNYGLESIQPQLKMLFSFGSSPSIESAILLVLTMLRCFEERTPPNIMGTLDYIAKNYINPSALSNNKDEYRLLITISLTSKILNSSSKISRKQFLQKICLFEDIVDGFNSLPAIDFIIDMVCSGSEIDFLWGYENEMSQKNGQGKYHKTSIDTKNWMQLLDKKQIITNLRKQFSPVFFEDKNSQTVDISAQKLKLLLQRLLKKRKTLTESFNLEQHFQNRLLELLMQSSSDSAAYCIQILQEYSLIPPCLHYVNPKIIKNLFCLLYHYLVNEKNYALAIVCLTLCDWSPINFSILEKLIRQKPEIFLSIAEQEGSNKVCQLLHCIQHLQLIEILMQVYHSMRWVHEFGENWMMEEDNYQFIGDSAKKERIIFDKRCAFISFARSLKVKEFSKNLSEEDPSIFPS